MSYINPNVVEPASKNKLEESSENEAMQWLEDHNGTTVLESRFYDQIEEA